MGLCGKSERWQGEGDAREIKWGKERDEEAGGWVVLSGGSAASRAAATDKGWLTTGDFALLSIFSLFFFVFCWFLSLTKVIDCLGSSVAMGRGTAVVVGRRWRLVVCYFLLWQLSISLFCIIVLFWLLSIA